MIKDKVKNIVRGILPLSLRKPIVTWMNGQEWIDPDRRYWWTMELLRDFAEKDINRYHKFMWANHLTYAVTYEVEKQFGNENMKRSRKIFFSELASVLSKLGKDVKKDINSIFEVGCSLGYQLRYLETEIFTSASKIEGIDIDDQAIVEGSHYLKELGSKVKITCADMEDISISMSDKLYDVLVCSGVLLYLNEESGTRLVELMLKHTGTLLAMSGLAHPEVDNKELKNSVTRDGDGTFIHNMDSMVKEAGGKVVARRWEGSKIFDGHTIYFIFALKEKG